MKILTGGQFRELDRYTIENEPIASIDLMERASQEIAKRIMACWQRSHRILVFAGPGNNGGDGLAVARMLGANGYEVLVWLFNVKDKLSEDCATNRRRLEQIATVTLTEVKTGFDFPQIKGTDIIIDALFGTGLTQPLSGGFAHVVHKINAAKPAEVISIDVPSGMMCEDNTYNDLHNIVRATVTLTIQVPKLAFLLPETGIMAGRWETVDIGLSEHGLELLTTPFFTIETEELQQTILPRNPFAHKGSKGHALLVSGSYGMAGAAILAGTSCLRSGVGKLTIQTPSTNTQILQTTLPEAVIRPDSSQRAITENLDTTNYNAVGIGPGIGLDDYTARALENYIVMSDAPLVIDADALNLVAMHSQWLKQIPAGTILTPHPKEFDRIAGQCTSGYERLMRAQELAIRQQLYIVLKGHNTAICTPSGRIMFCLAGNAGMATAGSGDVLTGIITSLLAQGYHAREAAMLGVWLHATAGDLAAEELEEECMIASDITSHLSGAFKRLRTITI